MTRIAAAGAGRMGRGIALAFAYAGHSVDLIDLKARDQSSWEALRDDAMQEIETSLRALHELEAIPEDAISRIQGRIHLVSSAEAAVALQRADVVFEGVPETLSAKRDAFALICESCSDRAILASTTSTILVTDLVPLVTRPERLINAHWLNPAYIIPLVEMSAHPGTQQSTIDDMRTLLESIGKVPVLCGATPGFIVPRLQALVMNEAARMVEEGVATAEDIDKATRYGMGLRFAALGVVEFIDFGGNDILFYASKYLASTVSQERFTAPDIVDRYMQEGRNGLRAGTGFYDYSNRDITAYRKEVMARTLGMLRHAGLYRAPR